MPDVLDRLLTKKEKHARWLKNYKPNPNEPKCKKCGTELVYLTYKNRSPRIKPKAHRGDWGKITPLYWCRKCKATRKPYKSQWD